ncbi:hypothetical protein [Aestuariibaculum suncheonense]|uniref:Fibronectin type-III domain-containing protein n=1 Tax=Aestuariibaculum suncheonense TaxID=1028745 RepID=A0A8J6Q6C8_9FLAO|nr:hypothetical protein [Aestuariibaculum suncheonense]MBD0834836.1 hypothetical protein [Aestuariibaculum suncheonense]
MSLYKCKNEIVACVWCLLTLFSCSSDDHQGQNNTNEPTKEITLPVLETSTIEAVEAFKATLWGKVINNGGSSISERGICYSINENPSYSDNYEKAGFVKGSGEFQVSLQNLQSGTTYYAKAYAVNEKGIGYGNEVSFSSLDIIAPTLKVGEIKVAGAHDIWLDVSVPNQGDLQIEEIGLVYGTTNNPTIEDNIVTREDVVLDFKARIPNLEPETSYYIKAYAKTLNGITYGDEVTMATIKKGNFTWAFWWEDKNEPAFGRLREAFDKAAWYYNNFTSIEKHVNVNYNTGTPTADANFDGWINFGANPDYQRTGTAMHEMAHTVGVGTHAKYWELMKGTWQGNRANEILQMMTNDPNAEIKGDNTHFWPYGINGAHEDDGSEMLYIIHALVLQGMKADGLPNK